MASSGKSILRNSAAIGMTQIAICASLGTCSKQRYQAYHKRAWILYQKGYSGAKLARVSGFHSLEMSWFEKILAALKQEEDF